jgi:ribonuclease HI
LVKKVELNVDGAARGNPGPAAIGVTVKDENNRMIASISERIGITTNNQAEYRALIAGLQKAISLGAQQVTVNSDSELMVKQLQGTYRVKNTGIKELYSEVTRLAYSLSSFQIVSVPREQNREADRLANMAFDS